MINSHKLLTWIETAGKRLPHPTLVFALLCLVIIAVSALFTALGASAMHPVTQEVFTAKSLLSQDGLLYMLTNTVSNFMNFAPLGPVLVAMLGIGLADKSGYLPLLVQNFAAKSSKALLSYAVVFIGVMSNLAADAGYVVLIPLAAMIYISFNRHPLAGIAAAFAGVSGGYSANLIIGPVDIILSGITSEAAQIVDPSIIVSASSNYWFLLVSTALITLLGGLITDTIVEPYLRKTYPINSLELKAKTANTPASITEQYKSSTAFRWASFTGGLYIFCVLALFYWQPVPIEQLMSGLVVLIALGFAFVGLVFGQLQLRSNSTALSKEPNKSWIVAALEETFSALAGYLVLMFFAAQFVAYFNWTQLGILTAIHGAQLFIAWSLPPIVLIILVILFSAVVNLLIGSASAKWTLIAPIVVPLFMLLELDPALIQLAYRIGDSSTNIVTPLMPYFALILAYTQQYVRTAHLGTIMAIMIPYSISFLIGSIILLIIWQIFGIPIGF